MKLPRTIRLDPSDAFVFDPAAEPGEWAVAGGFVFWNQDLESFSGKARQAFRAGFLGIDSFGWSTLVTIVEASVHERDEAIEVLAGQLVRHLGAPDIETARPAAAEEIDFAASLCDHPVGTILAVQRSVQEKEMREQFRTLHRREGGRVDHTHAFAFIEVTGEDEPEEHVDLLSLGRPAR